MTRSTLHQLSRPALVGLADAIAQKRVHLPCEPRTLANFIPTSLLTAIATELNQRYCEGMKAEHLACMINAIAYERQLSQQQRNAIDLVWTGEEAFGTESRDTRIVVQELFRRAKKSVLISSYALDTGGKAKALFQPLVDNMLANSQLKVRLFLNINRHYGDQKTSEATILRKFSERFRHEIWPSKCFPEVFYDPGSLSTDFNARTCLHAKCVVIDDEKLFLTSANFTEAAHQRNIEAGVLISDVISARAMRSQFEMLINRNLLQQVPGL